MKRCFIAFPTLVLLLFASTLWSKNLSPSNLMPVPYELKSNEGKFYLDGNTAFSFSNFQNERLTQNVQWILNRLNLRTTIFPEYDYMVDSFQSDTADVVIDVKREGELKINEDESYSLVISSEEVKITAETDLGALHALETLVQLLESDQTGYYFPAVEINDHPRFTWRGLMLDACRHFMPVEVVKRTLDAMAVVKLNVFHWHLTEDQGFRVESKVFPELTKYGSDGKYYTQTEIKDIIEYAALRGIRVIPEFDLPGHSTSWLISHPELASAPGPYKIERQWGIFDPTFNPTLDETYEFFDKFLEEMAKLFPDEYIHIGGDENNGKQWDANQQIQKFMKENDIPDNHSLQSYFNSKLYEILKKYGKKMVGWEEIAHPDMPRDIVAQCWRGPEAQYEAIKNGFNVILSRGYYIDLNFPAVQHYLVDPVPSQYDLTDEEKSRILGGEATMWSEFVAPENVDSRIWPRTAAIAERFWSDGSVKNVADMYRRLDIMEFRLENVGITSIKNYDMMLRRLTNNSEITPLKTLVDVVEPVKEYNRNRMRPHTQLSPLSRVVDAARPESRIARIFDNLVDSLVSNNTYNKETADKIESCLIAWKSNHSKLEKMIKVSPALKEVESLSKDLSSVAQIGLEALDFIKNDSKPNSEWKNSKLQILESTGEQRGQTKLMVLNSIEKLVNYAVE